MKPVLRNYKDENDYWRIRQFLREVFVLNSRREHSWNVARWDYFRWHLFQNCQICTSLESTVSIWEAPDKQIAAVMNPVEPDEAFIHIHPAFRSTELEEEMIAHAEHTFSNSGHDGARRLHIPVDEDDQFRKNILLRRGYTDTGHSGYEHSRDLNVPLPETPTPSGYTLRSMGGMEDHPSRSWASWLAFHADEPEGTYDGNCSWYLNVQSAPLYRRDLDIVAATADGQIVSFCTIYYDDATRSAVTVLVGTASPHQRQGLGKAVMCEGLRRMQRLGCTRVFSKATDLAADALYDSILNEKYTSETWIKDY
jgi:mycothiol synthase